MKDYPKIELSYIKKNFRLNWCGQREKVKPILTIPLRTTISPLKLIELIGEERANFLFNMMIKMKGEKKTYSVPGKGKLTVYVI